MGIRAGGVGGVGFKGDCTIIWIHTHTYVYVYYTVLCVCVHRRFETLLYNTVFV